MRKSLLFVFLIVILFGAVNVYSYTCTSAGTGDWSASGTWTNCNSTIPQNGDAVVIADGHTVTVDTSARTIPATGSITSITGSTNGIIAIPNANCATATPCAINVSGDITAPSASTASGFIRISGSTASTITITAAHAYGGAGNNAANIVSTATGGTQVFHLISAGNANVNSFGYYATSGSGISATVDYCTGGSGTTAHGCVFIASGAATSFTTTYDATGGTGIGACGVSVSGATSTVTLLRNWINGTGGVGWCGKTPTWTPGNSLYFKTSGGTYLYSDTDPGVANVKSGTTYYYQSGTIKTGTLESGGGGGAWGY